jgi:hypothetical protein
VPTSPASGEVEPKACRGRTPPDSRNMETV